MGVRYVGNNYGINKEKAMEKIQRFTWFDNRSTSTRTK